MPLYEFHCPNCGGHSELLVKMDEAGKDMPCPLCGEKGLQRRLSAFACPGVGGRDCSSCHGRDCSRCH